MDAKTQADIIAAAVKHYGVENQLLKTVEEMGELQRAIARVLIDSNVNDEPNMELIANLIEETADVRIMINQMTLILGVDMVTAEENRKLRRLAERMGMDIGEAAP